MSLTVVRTVDAWRALRPAMGTLGFVPTMGALHDGHLALVRRARAENDAAVASIYVNPTQFDNPDDLAAYPKTFDDDCRMLAAAGCAFVFAPTYAALYPDGYRYRVTETERARILEGAHRPGHFDGVLTVVAKLLLIIGAETAYFGEKDWQQLSLVRDMAHSLFVPTRIVACPTVREPDGLAMSSRNRRLNAAQRALAAHFPRVLADPNLCADEAAAQLVALGFSVDYVADWDGRRLGAVRMPPLDDGDTVRLIDNRPL
jgi:pantoate--beta-alanine ligase